MTLEFLSEVDENSKNMIRAPVRENQIVNGHNFWCDSQEPLLEVVCDEANTVLAWEKQGSSDHREVPP